MADQDVHGQESSSVSSRIESSLGEATEDKHRIKFLRGHIEELGAINSMTKRIAARLSLSEVVRTTLAEVHALVSPDLTLFFLREGQQLHFISSYSEDGVKGHDDTPTHCVGECLCGIAVSEGRPLFSMNIHSDPRCTWNECKDAGFVSFAALPLISDGKVKGVLGLASQKEKDFGARAQFLEVVSHSVAIGLSNALLYEELNRHARDLVRANDELEEEVKQRRQAEAEKTELIQQLEERNAALEQYAYTASHDLKAPLITVRTFLGAARQNLESGELERIDSDLRRVDDASTQMEKLLHSLLDVSRVGHKTNPTEDVWMNDLVDEALRVSSGRISERGIKVTVQPEMPVVTVDRERIVELLQNLIDNAAKFMGEQPAPSIKIGQISSDRKQLIFFVEDNGMGIDKRYQEKVFGLFEQLDVTREGTGVGLSIVKRIVENHGGSVWVESEGPGKGSRFCFTLGTKEPESTQ